MDQQQRAAWKTAQAMRFVNVEPFVSRELHLARNVERPRVATGSDADHG
jgi:hypothetical protein